jgi:hypothetical protein
MASQLIFRGENVLHSKPGGMHNLMKDNVQITWETVVVVHSREDEVHKQSGIPDRIL